MLKSGIVRGGVMLNQDDCCGAQDFCGVDYYLASGNIVMWRPGGFIGPVQNQWQARNPHPGWYVYQNFHVMTTICREGVVDILRDQYIRNLEASTTGRKADIERARTEIALIEARIRITANHVKRQLECSRRKTRS